MDSIHRRSDVMSHLTHQPFFYRRTNFVFIAANFHLFAAPLSRQLGFPWQGHHGDHLSLLEYTLVRA